MFSTSNLINVLVVIIGGCTSLLLIDVWRRRILKAVETAAIAKHLKMNSSPAPGPVHLQPLADLSPMKSPQ